VENKIDNQLKNKKKEDRMIGRKVVKNFRFFGRVLMLIASGYLLFPIQALPLPTGGQVVSGEASINQSGNQMTINQTTDRAIINWQGYSIDLNEIVRYIQPNANSISLNRVVGIDPSIILGQLIANGRVWIVNPNGIFFGKDAVINVGGILASTLNIKDSDFLSGKYEFTQDSNSALSSIINKGKIIINDNGYAILVAPLVSNEGLIVANLGKVIIAGTENFVVNFDGNNLINFTISKTSQTPGTVLIPSSQITNIIREVVNTPQIIEAGSIIEENGNIYLVGASGTVINAGTIKADGTEGKNAGTIILNSNQATVVARGSLISASGVGENSNGGEIRILSDMSSGFTGVGYGATIQAKSGQTGDGGFIEISGNKFQTWGNIDVSAENGKAGTFLLDPTDIYIRDSAINTQDYDDTGNNFPDYGGMGLAFGTADNDADLDGTSNEIASGYLTSLSGTIVLQATNDIIIDQITVNPLDWTIPGTTANLVLQAGRHIQFSNAGPFTINTNGGYIILEADSPHYLPSYDGIGTIDLGQVTLQTGGGNVTLIAANFNFPATASINAGSGNVYIARSVDGTPLGLGSVAGAQLTDAELDIITTTGTVTIGQATTAGDDGQGTNAQTLTAGTITVDDLNPANFQILVLVGSTIGDGANDTGVTVTSLTLYTSGSIGTGVDPLNINVGNLTVATSGTGNVTIYEADAITLSSISTFDGTIDITSGGPMTATSVSTGNNNDIYLITFAGDLVAGSINAGTGNVYLEANNNILDDANDTTVVKGNYISLIANNGDIGTGINGPIDIDLGSGTLTLTTAGASPAGNILVDETTGDLNLSRINITTDIATTQIIEIRNTDGNIIIDTAYGVGNDVLYLATTNVAGRDISFTGSGSITTNATVILNSSNEISGNPASGIDISAAAVELVAVNGIGSTNPIETAVSNLAANNTTSNDINITNTGALTITTVGLTPGVTNSGGNVSISASSPLTVNAAVTAAGNITLTAAGSTSVVTADDLTLNANVTSTVAGSTITLNAGDAIKQTSGSVSITGGGTIIATADTEGDSGADAQNAGFTQSVGTSFVSSGASAGPITISAYDNITINLLDAGSADVNVTSTNGAIDSVNYDGTADVIGGTINLMAASGGIGTSSILEVAASTALNADTTTDNSNILIDSIGNLPVGLVNAGTGDVTLNSTGAIDSVNYDGNADVIGGTINLMAASGGIGTSSILEVTATTALNADTTTDNSNILIDSIGNLPVGLVNAGTGDVTLNSTGAIDSVNYDGNADVIGGTINLMAASGGIGTSSILEVAASTALNAHTTTDNSNILIDSIGNLPVGLVNAGTGDVTLNSTGAIDSVNYDGNADVIGGTINLMAASGGIGTSSILEVAASTALNADTTTDNSNILIDSIGNLPVGLVNAGTGDVTLNSTGAIDSVNYDGNADVIGGTINLMAASGGIGTSSILEVAASTALNADTTTDNSNILIDSIGNLLVGLVNAGTGDVTLNSTGAIDSVNYDGNADVIGGTINLMAASGGIGTSSILEVAASTALNADTTTDNSNILIDSIGNLPVGLVNAGTGDVTLNATGYAITDANGGANNITATNLILIATNGIGSGDALETTVTNLDATNTDNNIEITNTGALTLVDLTSDTYSVINTNGFVNIVASSPLTVNSDVVAGGDITLTASGSALSGDNLTLNANVTSTGTGTTITLNAGDDIIQNIGSVSITGGGTIIATADTEGDSGADTDDAVFTQATGTSFVSNGGNITVSSYGNATIALLDAGYPSGGDVSVTSTNGSILDSDLGTVPADYDIKGHNVTLNAAGDIGSSVAGGEIDIQMDGILTLTAGGSAYLGFDGDVILGAISANNLTLTATGNILDDELATGGGPEDGATSDWTLVNITNNLNLTAGGRIGTDHNPNDRDMDAGYLDIYFGNTASFTAVDGLYLNFDMGVPLDTSKLTFNTPGTGIEVIMVNSSGDIFYNGFASAPNIAKENLIMVANGDFNFSLNSDIIHGLDIYNDRFLGIFATGTINLGVNIVSLNGDINIGADFEIGYLGISRDGVGAITQSIGKIVWVADYDNGLILEAGSGIRGATVFDPLDTKVRNLITYNTLGSGDIIISNTGTLNIVKDMPLYAYGVYNPVGNVYIETASPLNIIAPVVSSGDIVLVAYGADGDINLNLSNTGAYIQSTDSFIELMAGKEVNVNGDITAEDDVYIAAYRNIGISGGIITSGNNDYISLTADAGSNNNGLINQTGGKVGNDSVTGNITNLVLWAANGINLTNTDITYLQAINTTSGNIEITNTGIADGGIYTMGNGVINNATGGNIKITSFNPVTIDQPVRATGGNIEISSVNDFRIRNVISTTGSGTITLTATGANGYIRLYNGVINGSVQSVNGKITLNADQYIQMDSNTSITSNSGDIELNAGGNINVATITTGGNVIFDSGAAITDTNGLATNITSDTLTITAVSGIELDTNINTLNAEVADTGNIIIDEADGITLANVLTDDGVIIITASNGNIGVFYIRAEGSDGDITLIANSGSIIMNGSLTAFDDILLNAGNSIYGSGLVSGDLLTATAPNGISLNTSINTLTASTTNSNISITEANGLSLNDVTAWTGDVTLTLLAGTLTSNAGTKITGDDLVVSGAGAVNINTNVNTLTARTDNSNISIREINNPGDSGLALNLVDAGTGNVDIGVLYGAITDNNGNNLNIIGRDLILSAETGIGSGNAIETQVSKLAARVTSGAATGNIEIDNTGDLTLGNLAGWGEAVRNFGSGNINILVHSNLAIEDPIMTAGGDIILTANSGAIIQNTAGDITTLGGDYRATPAGPYTMADGAFVNTGSGLIDIDAGGNITLGQLISSSTVYLNSGGAIIDGGDTGGEDIQAAAVELVAVNGIGNTNAIDTKVAVLSASNTTGPVNINETNDLIIAGVGPTSGITTTGDINLSVGGNLVVYTNADLSSNGGTITITANHVSQNNNGDIISSGGNINMTIASLAQLPDSKINAGNGNVTISATGNILLDEINGYTVDIRTTGGNIEEQTPDTQRDITATNLILVAANGIGSNNTLQTDVSYLNAYNTSSGNINIDNAGDLTIDNFARMWAGYGVYNESGSVFIDVDGSINIPGTYGDGVYANDNVTLIASGNITAGSNNWITAVWSEYGNATLNAGNNIYLGQNYYSYIYADGDINLTAGNDITIDNYTYVESYDGDITIDAGRDINLITRVIDEETLISAYSGYLSLNAGRDININGGPSYVSTYSYEYTEIYAGNDINIIGGDIYADYGYLDIYAYNNVNIINTSTYSFGNTTIEAETGDVVIDPAGIIPESEIISDANIEINAGNNIIVLGSQVIAGDSAYLEAGNDIQIGYVEAGNTVSMEAGGSIYDNNQEGMNIVATNLVLLAGKGIGNYNGQIDPIETSVSNLQAVAEDGDIYIDNTGDLNLVDINSLSFAVAAKGDIEIKTTNDMTISGLVEATGSVYLYAIDGGIIDNLYNDAATPYDIIAGKTSGLYAGDGTIGIESGAGWFDPLEVNITGDLYVYASSMYNFVSVAIDGIVSPRDILLTRSDWGVPPGLIIFNGRVNGGGESGRWFRATGNAIHYIGIVPYIYETLMLYIIDPTYFEPAPEYWDVIKYEKAIEDIALK
jgi:filamentous hemagglutinin family protein